MLAPIKKLLIAVRRTEGEVSKYKNQKYSGGVDRKEDISGVRKR